ncbi:MAG: hypothetical protein V9G19_23955 [Tetrasphaera sp.]
MRSIELALEGGGKVLLAGLVFGAGLPIIYALGMRLLTVGAVETTSANGPETVRYSTLGKGMAALLLAVIVGAVALGITLIAASGFGKAVSFEHVIPTIVEKK